MNRIRCTHHKYSNRKQNHSNSIALFISWNFLLNFFHSKIFAYGEADGTACKIAGFHCNSYFKLFIGGKEVFRSQTRKDQFVYDAEYTHVTGKIPKDTKIKIEVYDESSAFFEKTHLILSTGYKTNFNIFLRLKPIAADLISYFQKEMSNRS